MNKKKLLIITIILLILVLLLLLFLKQYGGNIKYKIQMQDVKKGIVIVECSTSHGSAVEPLIRKNYYYVDLERQTIYHVEITHVSQVRFFFERIGHYTLIDQKVLTSSEIAEIMRLTTLPSDSNDDNYNSNNSDTILFLSSPTYNYYNITYNGKTKSLSESTVSSFIQIVNDI